MTCNECIHKVVCYRVDSVPSDYAQKCGDFVSGCKALDQEPCTVSVSEKEPNEITEEVTLRFFKNSLKVRWHNFVIYNVEWLKRHWQMEMYIVCGVKPCEDAISRQAVLDGIEELKKSPWAYKNGFDYLIVEALDVVADLCVKQLPPVNPQKTGHWIDEFGGCKCSECGWSEGGYSDFCPNCGARMQEEEE